MKSFVKAIVIVFLALSSCSTPHVKVRPEYAGVSPKLEPYVQEYLWLAKQNKIKFKGKVTAGFTKIDMENVIGLCTYSPLFREVDIDSNYWENATSFTKMALVYHELSHCYCTRNHDHGQGKKYPTQPMEQIKDMLKWELGAGEVTGYMKDGCPVTLMHPSIIDDYCMMVHYQAYIDEMFNRCNPY